MITIDAEFSQAQWQALQGDATAMAAILRDGARPLDSNEREVLALMIERLAEHTRGDIGGEVGRREIGAGHPKVSRAVERYEVLLGEGRQRSEAKLIVADEQGLSKRRVEDYIKLHRERKEQVALLTAQYAIK